MIAPPFHCSQKMFDIKYLIDKRHMCLRHGNSRPLSEMVHLYFLPLFTNYLTVLHMPEKEEIVILFPYLHRFHVILIIWLHSWQLCIFVHGPFCFLALGDIRSLPWNLVGACRHPTSDTVGHSLDYLLGVRLWDHSTKLKSSFPGAESVGDMAEKMNQETFLWFF